MKNQHDKNVYNDIPKLNYFRNHLAEFGIYRTKITF